MLNSHPELCVYDEIRSYDLLRDSLYLNHPDCQNSNIKYGFKIPRWTPWVLEKEIPEDVDLYGGGGFYSGQPLLFMLRDPIDTVSSMLRLKDAGHLWIEHWANRLLKSWIANFPWIDKELENELTILERESFSNISVGAVYCCFFLKVFKKYFYGPTPLNLIAVSYEGLTHHPREIMTKVLNGLDVSWSEKVLQHHLEKHGEVFSDGKTLGNTDPSKSLNPDSVGKGRAELSEKEIDIINETCGELWGELNNVLMENSGIMIKS